MKTAILCIILLFTVSWSLDRKTESRSAVETKKTCFADLSSGATDVRGKWIQKPSPIPIYGKLSCPMEWSKYACAKITQNCYRNHTFVVTSCVSEYFQFEPLGFLKTLAGRTMAFIGDSLTRQHFISIICHLHHHAVPEMKHQVFNHSSYSYISPITTYSQSTHIYIIFSAGNSLGNRQGLALWGRYVWICQKRPSQVN